MINVAILSFWHVHADEYTDYAMKHTKTKVVGVWDEIEERGKAKAWELGVPFYSNLEELLNNPDIDAVIVGCPTNLHRVVLSQAIKAKKHVFTEKVITPKFEDALEISSLVDHNQVAFTVSLPRVNTWYTQTILEQLAQGRIGKITSTRVRHSHNGSLLTKENPKGWLPEHFYSLELCSGGALIDLGCHAVYLTRLFQGMPQFVYSEFGYVTGREVEDISTSIFQYQNGSIGTVEVSFVNAKSPFTIEIHGTEGFILFSDDVNEVRINSIHNEDNSPIVFVENNFSDELTSDFEQWLLNIEANSNIQSNINLGIELTKIIEACYISQKSGKKIQIK